MHKPLSSFSDLLNHYQKAAGHGEPPSISLCFASIHSSSLPIILSILYIFKGTMRITGSVLAEVIFYLSNQVSQVANAVSNSISVNQPGCDGFVKETILLRIDMQENETQENSNSD